MENSGGQYDSAAILELSADKTQKYYRGFHEDEKEDDDVDTFYSYEISKISDTKKTREFLDYHGGEYIANSKYSCLLETTIFQELGPFSVKKEHENDIKIAIGHNGVCNIFKSSILAIGGFKFPKIDPVTLDCYLQYRRYYQMENGINETKKEIGSIPKVEEFSNIIDADEYIIRVPFPFMKNPKLGIPLYMLPEQETVRFIFEKRNHIKDILRMKERKVVDGKDTWEDIEVNLSYLNFDHNGVIQQHKILGTYCTLTDAEINFFQELGEKKLLYEVISSADLDNPVNCGTFRKPITDDGPVTLIFIMAENIKSKYFNDFSNYTNSPLDRKKGIDPLKTISLQYNGKERLPTLPAKAYRTGNFSCIPFEEGYHALNFQTKKDGNSNINAETAIYPKNNNTEIVFELKDQGPNPTINYNIKIRIVSLVEIKFVKGQKMSIKFNRS